jgi:membrane protease YdiL (CAAX protease family)
MKKTVALKRIKTFRIIEFLLVTLFPVSIMTFGLVPAVFHYLLLIIVVTYAGIAIAYRKWTRYDLGIRTDTLIYWKEYSLWTVAAVIFVWWVYHEIGMSKPLWSHLMLAKLMLVSVLLSFLQEFLYRGYLFRLFEDVTKRRLWIVIPNIIVFAYMHTIFPNWRVIIPLTAAGGILFALIYHRYPNFWLISGMHFALNFTALYLGFFPVALLHMNGV